MKNMKAIFKTVMAGLLCLANVSIAQAADKVIKLEYKVPTNLKLVTGKGDGKGAYIYKKPDLKSPKLLYVDQGEGSFYQWSNEKKTMHRSSYSTSQFGKYWFSPNLGTSGNFVKTAEGYVEKNKTLSVAIQPLTLNDLKKGGEYQEFQVITKGKFKDYVVYDLEGEGGVSYYIGRIHDGVAVFFMSIYSEDVDGGYELDDCHHYSEACHDFNEFTDQELGKLFGNKSCKTQLIVFKHNGKLQDLWLEDISKLPCKTVTETITF